MVLLLFLVLYSFFYILFNSTSCSFNEIYISFSDLQSIAKHHQHHLHSPVNVKKKSTTNINPLLKNLHCNTNKTKAYKCYAVKICHWLSITSTLSVDSKFILHMAKHIKRMSFLSKNHYS